SGGKNRVSSADWPAARTEPEVPSFARIPSSPKLDHIGEQLLSSNGIRSVKQVIVDLYSEQPVGYEMLCRGPSGPFESPLHFFRVSLEQNILTPVDLRCLQACVQGANSLDGMRIHLNMFPSTMLATPTTRL